MEAAAGRQISDLSSNCKEPTAVLSEAGMAMALMRRIGSVLCGGSVESRA